MKEFLYGKTPILEALRAGRRKVHRLYLLQKKSGSPLYNRQPNTSSRDSAHPKALEQLLDLAGQQKIECQERAPQWFEQNLGLVNHQGWAAEASPLPVLASAAEEKKWLAHLSDSHPATILALDQIQDPQNLGAVLRTAEACGVESVLVTEQRSAPLSPAVSRASAGAMEHLKILQVKNLVRTLKSLQKQNFWVVGTAVEDDVENDKNSPQVQSALDFDWPKRCVLVLGSEGQGMRRLTREACDFLIHLPLLGKIASLNVAATAAACLYLQKSHRVLTKVLA